MKYTYTTQSHVRAAFWDEFPELTFLPGKRQNDYPTNTRCTFVDFVDGLVRNKMISDSLAHRVTL